MRSKIIAVTLLAGTAVLGAAGVATAAPDPTPALDAVTSTLPLEEAARTLPAGAPEALAAGQNALASGLSTAKPTIEQSAQALGAEGDPVSGLLGGLPVQQRLPTSGLPVSGLPVG